jgi:hypothetical protein
MVWVLMDGIPEDNAKVQQRQNFGKGRVKIVVPRRILSTIVWNDHKNCVQSGVAGISRQMKSLWISTCPTKGKEYDPHVSALISGSTEWV